MGITRIFENSGEKNCENWLENEFTSFAENAITSIFAKGWDSLGFSKKMVKKTAKIGQKMNSVSYLEEGAVDGLSSWPWLGEKREMPWIVKSKPYIPKHNFYVH